MPTKIINLPLFLFFWVLYKRKTSNNDISLNFSSVIDDSISTEAITGYLDIFQYHFNNNLSFITKFDNNPKLFKELSSLFLKGLIKK